MRIVCDSEKCVGCLACVVACMDRHCDGADAGALSPRLHRKVVRSGGVLQHETDSCRHCVDAPCAASCPVGALQRSETGIVVHDRERCVGCGLCVRVCPYEIPRIHNGKMVKCDLCEGGAPACVGYCPFGALRVEE